MVSFTLILQGLENLNIFILALSYSRYRLSAFSILNKYIPEEWLIKLSQSFLVYFMLENVQRVVFGQNIFTVSQMK